MPSPTTPDAITRWIISDAGSLLSESVAQGNSLQTALDSRQLRTFRWADDSARNSQLTVRDGDMGYQIDTGVWYNRAGSAWVVQIASDDTGWITVSSFLNSWTAAVTVQYRRLGGIVYLRGRLTGGTTGTAFTLPAGFRPGGSTAYFPAIQGTAVTLNLVSITTAGAVGCTLAQVPNLSGISFPNG